VIFAKDVVGEDAKAKAKTAEARPDHAAGKHPL
jgi:hypothetical protein